MSLREAATQALEALEDMDSDDPELNQEWLGKKAITALRAALAEPVQEPTDWEAVAADQAMTIALLRTEPVQEPVAWMYRGIRHDGTPHDRPSLIWRPEYMDAMSADKAAKATPLYASPPGRKPLSDDEARDVVNAAAEDFHRRGHAGEFLEWATHFTRAIERAHGIGGQDESA